MNVTMLYLFKLLFADTSSPTCVCFFLSDIFRHRGHSTHSSLELRCLVSAFLIGNAALKSNLNFSGIVTSLPFFMICRDGFTRKKKRPNSGSSTSCRLSNAFSISLNVESINDPHQL